MNRIFGIPLICFFDDFGAMVPSEIALAALDFFTLFCHKLWITLEPSKSELGQRVTFIGLSGSFPRKENNWQLEVSLSREKALLWADDIRTHT